MRRWVTVELQLKNEGVEAYETMANLLKNRIVELFQNHPAYSTFADTENVNVRVVTEDYRA